MTAVKENTNSKNTRNNPKRVFLLVPQYPLSLLSRRLLFILLTTLPQVFIAQPIFAITFTPEPAIVQTISQGSQSSAPVTANDESEISTTSLNNASTPAIIGDTQQDAQPSSAAELENATTSAVSEIAPIIAEEKATPKSKKLRKPKKEKKLSNKKTKNKQEQEPVSLPTTTFTTEVVPAPYPTSESDVVEMTVEAFPKKDDDKLLNSADEPDYSQELGDVKDPANPEPDYNTPLNANNLEKNALLKEKYPQKIAPTSLETSTLKNTSSALITAPREKFVSEFEHFVATKIAPNVPGLALAIIADGKVKVLQGYGKKRVDGHEVVNTNTVFRLASVSKTIASTAAAVLVRDGKINWDTTINSLIPEVRFSNPRYGDKITVRDIMSQATGLPTHTNTHLIEDNMSYADAVGRLRHVNFVCPPGKCYAYQNVTFSLISNITLKKTGTVFDKYVNEKIFKPLGMLSASFGLAGLQATNNFAQPHIMNRSRWITTSIDENYYHINPAAGANASITDMSRWVLAQMGHNPDVLSSELLNQLHKKVTRNTAAQSHYGANIGATDTHYGLGWRIFDYRGEKNFVHHGGWVKGFRSEVVFNQELQIGMVLLTNSETKLARNIIFKFLDAYADDKEELKKVAQLNKNPNVSVGY
jgi:beta-lactamase class C